MICATFWIMGKTMSDEIQFAARIRERYPEGLTGIYAVGGTRTAYILERKRYSQNPGQIDDFADYAQYTLNQYLRLLKDYFELGGRNLIIPPLSYQAFYERGEEYTRIILKYTLQLIGDQATTLYEQCEADPYFVGIDTLLQLPDTQAIRGLGVKLQQFQNEWPYSPGRRKIIWEIAPIPLYSFWRADLVMPAAARREVETALNSTTDMLEMYRVLFSYYSRAALGVEIPVPHLYIGTNRNGDLKLRSMIPIALMAGGPFRLFYLPYPSLFMTRSVLQTILTDLAFGSKSSSKGYDYSGQYTSEYAQAEYRRVLELVSDPQAIVGLKATRDSSAFSGPEETGRQQ
jgi:hypothetical protein